MEVDCKKLNERRKELKLTIKDVAQISGLPQVTIKNVLYGQRKTPRFDTLRAIEKALGLSADDCESNTSIKELRLLQSFNRLIPAMQDYIIDMCERLTEEPNSVNTDIKRG